MPDSLKKKRIKMNRNVQPSNDTIPPLGLYTDSNKSAPSNTSDVKEGNASSELPTLEVESGNSDNKPAYDSNNNNTIRSSTTSSGSSSGHRKQYARSSESFDSNDNEDDELGTSFSYDAPPPADAHDDSSHHTNPMIKTLHASAPISMDRDSSSRSSSPMSKSSSRHTRRRGITGGSVTGASYSPTGGRRGRLQRKSSSAGGVGAGYRRSATVPREGVVGRASSSTPNSSPKRATPRTTPVSPEELKAIRDTAAEMIERVTQREQQKLTSLQVPVLAGHQQHSPTKKRDSEGSRGSRKDEQESPRGSPTRDGRLPSDKSSNLGFSNRTLGQMFDNAIDDEDDWELGGLGSYPIPPTLGDRKTLQQQKERRKGGFSANPLRFPRKANNHSDDSTGSASSFSLFKSALFGGGSGGGGTKDTIYEESVSFSEEGSPPPAATNKLGSTMLAERGERFGTAVDQSINLMDASGASYFPSTDRTDSPSNQRRGHSGSGNSGSPSLTTTRENRRRDAINNNKRRGTIFDLMFGKGSSKSPESDTTTIQRIPRGRSPKQHIRKTNSHRKSMVDVVLGGDPRRSLTPTRYFAELEKEEEKEEWWNTWKKRIATTCLGLFVVAHLIMGAFLLYWLIVSNSNNGSNDKIGSSSPTPSPTPAPTPAPTASPSSIQHASTSVSKEDAALANSLLSGISSAVETVRSAVNLPVMNHTKSDMVEDAGVKSSSSSVLLDAAKNSSSMDSLGDDAEMSADSDDNSNDDFWNDDTLTHLESIVMRYNLTSQKDLRNPESDAYAALQWLNQFQNNGRRKTIEVDDTDEQQQQQQDHDEEEDADWKDHQKDIEKYVLAVFHFATHPYDDRKRRILKEPSAARTSTTKAHHHQQHTSSSSSSLPHRAPEVRPNLKQSNHAAGIPGFNHLENGLEGTAWMKDDSVCDWRGIKCKDGVVTHVKVKEFALHGTIPSEIRGLKDLLELDLSRNHLHGTIPPAIGKLTRLTYLDLKKNKLKGTLPGTLGQLTALHGINLEMNALEGTIPSSLFQDKTDLKLIRLPSNQLQGTIPPLLNLPKLLDLDLSTNMLHGPLPPIDNLPKLTNLRLHDNEVTGSIPPSWDQLDKLESMILHHNEVSGDLPDFLSSMFHLKDIRLNHNALTGPIPDMEELIHLEHLHLNNNQFSGSLPSVALDNLETLLLFQNKIVGTAEIICDSDDVYNHLQRFAADCKSSVSCNCCHECF